MTYKLSIHIFRRDLRVFDNTALLEALKASEEVIPIFILDPRQTNPHPYRSENGLQFMVTSLIDLNTQLNEVGSKLNIFEGTPAKVLDEITTRHPIKAVYFNRDYSPYSRKRDEEIYHLLKPKSIQLHTYHDALLHPPKEVVKSDGAPYTVFTPYYKRGEKIPVRNVHEGRSLNLFKGDVFGAHPIESLENKFPRQNEEIFRRGGRSEALTIISRFENLLSYNAERDIPSIHGTSGLSPHNKFGTVSIREVYWAAKRIFPPEHRFISELYWRDFFTQIGFHFPHVFEGAFHSVYDRLEWSENEDDFQRWCSGETGFPIVDAGMRELNRTGYMHNRVRMITASFLTKDLHISWRWGEKYFASKLVDYDPAVNNGSWQWAASTGCDAQPYFRIFNPWLQQVKFDPDALYIKRWVPELSKLKPKEIHSLNEARPATLDYPSPMVDHSVEKGHAEDMFSEIKGKRP